MQILFADVGQIMVWGACACLSYVRCGEGLYYDCQLYLCLNNFNFYACSNKHGTECKCRVVCVCDINLEKVEFVFHGHITTNELKAAKLQLSIPQSRAGHAMAKTSEPHR